MIRRRNFAPPQLLEVSTPFAPHALPPGAYVASSRTAGFGPLLSAISLGYAKFGGERIDIHGVKTVLGLVGRERNQARQIGIAREFFTTVLKDYRDWKVKWWREAIQNAVDADGTRIKLETVQQDDGTWKIAVDDNGSGMDAATLVDKFLMLGATTKVGAAGVGGFGKAKELLILPWLKWKVHTRDNLAVGSGVQYELRRVEMRQGLRLEVVMPADQFTPSAAAITFVEKSYLPGITFEVYNRANDLPEPTRQTIRAKLQPRDLLGEVPGKAELYTTRVKYSANSIYVRVNGLFMFTSYVGDTGNKQVLAEITAPSVDILTANRDGFRDWEVADAIDRFSERLAKDTKTALAQKSGLIRQKYPGKGKFRTEQLQAAALQNLGPIPYTSRRGLSLSTHDTQAIVGVVDQMRRRGATFAVDEPAPNAIASLPPREVAQEFLNISFRGSDHVEEAVRQLVWEPDFYLVNEVEGFRVPKKFKPESMTPHVLKLAKVWTELCRFVLMQLGSFQEFGVGFVISEDAGAQYLKEGGEHWLLLNPYVDSRERRETWKPSKRDHQKWLYAAAVHEVTHLADGLEYHDESFASALTFNIARTADGFRKVGKIVTSLKMRGAPELEAEAMAMNPGRRWRRRTL